ncbi:MAG TPA: hypothetical protein PKJ95_05240 [Atribacterota bacterium]|nr:hypothetical protein [Atribacterota bacterium]
MQAEMADGAISGNVDGAVIIAEKGGMQNPYGGTVVVVKSGWTAVAGAVCITPCGTDDGTCYKFQGYDNSATPKLFGDELTAQR